MNKQLDIDTADIIAAIETELAANWYARAAAERRAQREGAGESVIIAGATWHITSIDYSVPADTPSWGDFALALAVWAVFPALLLLGMWALGMV